MIHSFPTIYITGDTIQGGLGPQISNLSASNKFGKYPKSSKVLPFSFPEKLKKLPNELWARPVVSKLSGRWHPRLFLGADKKMATTFFFSYFGQLVEILIMRLI